LHSLITFKELALPADSAENQTRHPKGRRVFYFFSPQNFAAKNSPLAPAPFSFLKTRANEKLKNIFARESYGARVKFFSRAKIFFANKKYFRARKKVIPTIRAKKFYARVCVSDNCIRLRSTFRRHEPRESNSLERVRRAGA
jgi:hypothetical protein